MIQPSDTETSRAVTGTAPARKGEAPTLAGRYVVASLSPIQVDMVRAIEDLLSLATGKRVTVVVYESQ